jgi:hypothetical protein
MRKQINPSANYWRTKTWKGRHTMTQPSKINPGINPRTSASETVKSRIPAGGEVDCSQYAGKDPGQRRGERPQ